MRQALEPGTYDSIPDQAYYFHAGYRQYPQDATVANPKTKAGDSATATTNDGATATLLGSVASASAAAKLLVVGIVAKAATKIIDFVSTHAKKIIGVVIIVVIIVVRK